MLQLLLWIGLFDAIITILALVLLAKRVRGPAALPKPFSRH